MCPYISLKDGCKYGRALVSVKNCLNINEIEDRIKKSIGVEDNHIICTGFFEMSKEDYMSNYMGELSITNG